MTLNIAILMESSQFMATNSEKILIHHQLVKESKGSKTHSYLYQIAKFILWK